MSTNGLTRTTFNMTTRNHRTLCDVAERTGDSKTDVINRSLQVYALVEDMLDRNEGKLQVVHKDGTEETIYIL